MNVMAGEERIRAAAEHLPHVCRASSGALSAVQVDLEYADTSGSRICSTTRRANAPARLLREAAFTSASTPGSTEPRARNRWLSRRHPGDRHRRPGPGLVAGAGGRRASGQKGQRPRNQEKHVRRDGLAFAAAAMLYVVADELIPEPQSHGCIACRGSVWQTLSVWPVHGVADLRRGSV